MTVHRVVVGPEKQDRNFEGFSDCAFCDAPRIPLLELPVCGKHARKLYGEMQDLIAVQEAANPLLGVQGLS
jgi:hypothetical protein